MRLALVPLALLAACSSSPTGPPNTAPRRFYVANTGGPSITAYTTADTGNAAPALTISGTNTTLDQPEGIVLDPTGIVLTTSANPWRVLVFAANTIGDAAPVAAITGSNTALSHPTGLALDSRGRLFVANAGSNSILIFANGASGNVAPSGMITGSNTLLAAPAGIALDLRGRLYVANTQSNVVTVFAAGANGNARPVDTIAGPATGLDAPRGITLDPGGRIYVANSSSGAATSRVTVFAATATGNATPVATISGNSTGLDQPTGITLDGAGNIYVASTAFTSNQYRITVYAASANGNIAPLRTLSGTNTGLSVPSHLSF